MKVKIIYSDSEKVINVDETKEIWVEVIPKATKVFNLPPPPINYQLFYPRKPTEMMLLDPHKSLKEKNIPEGATLVLAHIHIVGDWRG